MRQGPGPASPGSRRALKASLDSGAGGGRRLLTVQQGRLGSAFYPPAAARDGVWVHEGAGLEPPPALTGWGEHVGCAGRPRAVANACAAAPRRRQLGAHGRLACTRGESAPPDRRPAIPDRRGVQISSPCGPPRALYPAPGPPQLGPSPVLDARDGPGPGPLPRVCAIQ